MEQLYTIDGITYVGIDWLSYSNYSGGGAVARANVRDVLAMAATKAELPYRVISDFDCAEKYYDYRHDAETIKTWKLRPDAIHLYGGYDTNEILIRSDWEHADDIRSTLADYPCLNDETVSKVEHEMEKEAWDSWIKSDFQSALIRLMGGEDDVYDFAHETDNLFELYIAGCESSGEYGYVDGDAWWIDVDLIARHAINATRAAMSAASD